MPAVLLKLRTEVFPTVLRLPSKEHNPVAGVAIAKIWRLFPLPGGVTIVGVKGTNSYDPNPIYIKAGDTVTWINVDVIAHTVTSGKDYNRLTSGLLFHSGSIISNTAYSHTFNIP